MTIQTIAIPDNALVSTIRDLQISLAARQDMLAYMLKNDADARKNEGFRRYHSDYESIYRTLDAAKQTLVETYIFPVIGSNADASWTLDFATAQVTVTLEDAEERG